MLTRRLWERVPSASPITVATLTGYKLCWHKVSSDESGKCDVVWTGNQADLVIGVVYEIQHTEKSRLDAAEGLGKGYDEKQIELKTEQGKIQAQVYYATKIDPQALPYTWYKSLVVAGAKEHGFPDAYIKALEAIRAKADLNKQRVDKNLAILNASL